MIQSGRKLKRTMEISEMIKHYKEGYSTTEIGDMANVSARYVCSVLTENNVEKRPRGSWKRKYHLNEDYFKILFSDWMYREKGLYLKRKYEAFQQEKLDVSLLQDSIKTHKNALEKRRKGKTNISN